MRTDPRPLFKHNRLQMHGAPVFRVKIMIDGCENDIMPYQTLITDSNATLILEPASGVNENIIPYTNVFPKSEVKGKNKENPSSSS